VRGGCFTQNYQRGYILAEGALEQIPLGAPQEQVLITLGTPSTVATVSGEVFYYISKRTEQTTSLTCSRFSAGSSGARTRDRLAPNR